MLLKENPYSPPSAELYAKTKSNIINKMGILLFSTPHLIITLLLWIWVLFINTKISHVTLFKGAVVFSLITMMSCFMGRIVAEKIIKVHTFPYFWLCLVGIILSAIVSLLYRMVGLMLLFLNAPNNVDALRIIQFNGGIFDGIVGDILSSAIVYIPMSFVFGFILFIMQKRWGFGVNKSHL